MKMTMNWLNLEDKVIVVTGGSGGIGRAVLQSFYAAGSRVVALDYAQADAESAAADTDPTGRRALGLQCDVSSKDSIQSAAQKVERLWGPADVLVNNAGILRAGPLESLPLEDWTRMLEVNLNGCFLAAQAFGCQMLSAGRGALIHVSSISASQPQPFSGAYSASKAAISMMSRQLAYEWGARGVRSNVVSPGMVETPLSQAFYTDSNVRKAREQFVPVGRIGKPQDMADATVFLASHRASYINGQEIVVDGGLSQTIMGSVPRPGYAP